MYRTIDIEGKSFLFKTEIKKHYYYDIFFSYIKDDFRKTLVEENYELEINVQHITDLPKDEDAIPMLYALFNEANPSNLKDNELDTVEITLAYGPLEYEELRDELIGEV